MEAAAPRNEASAHHCPVTPRLATDSVDAVVVGAGPNGLAAAITIAREGRSVRVLERADEPGGGARTAELTLPGFRHDVCSAVHPFGRTSPFFRELRLERHGLRWVEPPAAIAHPLDGGRAVIVTRDVDATAAQLSRDGDAYRRLFSPLARSFEALIPDVLAPFHVPLGPRRALRLARFGLDAIQPAAWVARRFRDDAARALLAGAAAHSLLRLTEPVSGAGALLLLGSAHHDGWPFPAGGAGAITDALVAELEAQGGQLRTGVDVQAVADLQRSRVAIFDTGPRQIATVAGSRLPAGYRRKLQGYRYGPAMFKVDFALDGPIPWQNEEVGRAGTVHLGGTLEEIARSEADANDGRISPSPYVLLAQHSPFDPSRAPAGKHTAWAYCHVPHGSTVDMTAAIVGQIERFAPGFGDRILATHTIDAAALEAYNPNNVGGDMSGGRIDLRQLFTRPSARIDPYSTPDPRIFQCSSATPPGGGVHGMCGWHAAHSVLRRLRSA
jgi:phytoene dehydrogenase-like protein